MGTIKFDMEETLKPVEEIPNVQGWTLEYKTYENETFTKINILLREPLNAISRYLTTRRG